MQLTEAICLKLTEAINILVYVVYVAVPDWSVTSNTQNN